LDLAIDFGREKCAQVLIESDFWKDCLRNKSSSAFSEISTPMRKLIQKMPSVAVQVFNKCMVDEKDMDDPEYKITFNYEFLDDEFLVEKWEDDASHHSNLDATEKPVSAKR